MRHKHSSIVELNDTYRFIYMKLLILGGGTGGVTVAAQLRKINPSISMTIVDNALNHFYQPGFTLVGGGLMNPNRLSKPTQSIIPEGVNFILDKATQINPEKNKVELESGKTINYDALLVATGLKVDFDSIKGLKNALESNAPVTSIYDIKYAKKHSSLLPFLKQKQDHRLELHFTQPSTAIKCGGAPQKILYLTEHTLRHNDLTTIANRSLPKFDLQKLIDVRKPEFAYLSPLATEQPDHPNSRFTFHLCSETIFGCPHYAEVLEDLRVRRQVDAKYNHELVEISSNGREAVFKDTKTKEFHNVKFDLLHAVPNMYPPDIIKNNTFELSDSSGYVNVNPDTLQHVKYPNIFAIGDSSNLPTSKTAAGIASQAPVLVHNLNSFFTGSNSQAIYDGYTSCPIIISGGNLLQSKLILAEFDYSKKPKESCSWFLGDQRTPSRIGAIIKRYIFLPVYWNAFLRGTWFGRNLFSAPHLIMKGRSEKK